MRPVPLSLLSFLLVALGIVSGCQQNMGGSQGPLSIPPEGNVRIISRKIEQTADRLHWKWSIIGERNWIGATATDGQMTLTETYPANSTTQRGGCNIWECDLVAERTGDSLRWKSTIHGSIGKTAEGSGQLPLPAGTASDKSVQIELDRDRVVSLPAQLTLARVGDKTITLQIAK